MSAPRAGADLRWLRALVVALVAATIGVVGHVSAGGLLPGLPVLGGLVGGLAVLAAAVLGRPASYLGLAALVGGGQVAVHLALATTAGHRAGPATGHHHVGHGASAPAGEAGPASSAPPWLEVVGEHLTGPNLAMMLAHLGAASVVAFWLFVAEQAVWTLVALLGAHVLALVGWVLLPHGDVRTVTGAARATAGPGTTRRRRTAAHGPTGRRGPPRPHAALLTPTT